MTQFPPQPAVTRCVSTADSANTARIEWRKKQGDATRSVGWGRASGIIRHRQSEQAVTYSEALGGRAGIEMGNLILAKAPVSPGHFNSTTED